MESNTAKRQEDSKRVLFRILQLLYLYSTSTSRSRILRILLYEMYEKTLKGGFVDVESS